MRRCASRDGHEEKTRKEEDKKRVLSISKIIWDEILSPWWRGLKWRAMTTDKAVRAVLETDNMKRFKSHHWVVPISNYYALVCAAAAGGSGSCAKWILRHKQTRNNNRECSALLWGFCRAGDLTRAKRLLQGGDLWKGCPLWPVSDSGFMSEVRVDPPTYHTADVKPRIRYTLLGEACKGPRNLPLVQWLLSEFNMNEESPGAFLVALSHGNLEIAQWLCGTPDVKRAHDLLQASLPVHYCSCASGQLDIVKWCFQEFSDEYLTAEAKKEMVLVFMRSGRSVQELIEGYLWFRDHFPNLDPDKVTQCASHVSLSLMQWLMDKQHTKAPTIRYTGTRQCIEWLIRSNHVSDLREAFIRVCGNFKDDVSVVKLLAAKTKPTREDLVKSLIMALYYNNTAVATWLDDTFHIMEKSDNAGVAFILLKLCEGHCGCNNIDGPKWLLQHLGTNILPPGVIKKALHSHICHPFTLLLLKSFPRPAKNDRGTWNNILMRTVRGNISDVRAIVPFGHFTQPEVAKCLITQGNGLHSTKILKWLITTYRLTGEHVKAHNNWVLMSRISMWKTSSALWLIDKFHITLPEILPGVIPFLKGCVSMQNYLGSWRALLRVFPRITASVVRRNFMPIVTATPLHMELTMHQIGLSLDDLVEYYNKFQSNEFPIEITTPTWTVADTVEHFMASLPKRPEGNFGFKVGNKWLEDSGLILSQKLTSGATVKLKRKRFGRKGDPSTKHPICIPVVPLENYVEKPLELLLIGNGNVGKTSLLKRFLNQHSTTLLEKTETYVMASIRVANKHVHVKCWDVCSNTLPKDASALGPYISMADGIGIVFDVTDEYSFQSVWSWVDLVKRTHMKSTGTQSTPPASPSSPSTTTTTTAIATPQSTSLTTSNSAIPLTSSWTQNSPGTPRGHLPRLDPLFNKLFLLIGNKRDAADEFSVTTTSAQTLARHIGVKYVETSATSNVEEVVFCDISVPLQHVSPYTVLAQLAHNSRVIREEWIQRKTILAGMAAETNILGSWNLFKKFVLPIVEAPVTCTALHSGYFDGTQFDASSSYENITISPLEIGLIIKAKGKNRCCKTVPITPRTQFHIVGNDFVLQSTETSKSYMFVGLNLAPSVFLQNIKSGTILVSETITQIVTNVQGLVKLNCTIYPDTLQDLTFITKGGCGEVWKGQILDHQVAAKKIRPEQVQDPSIRQQFLREMLLLSELKHEPNVVEFLGLCVDPPRNSGIWMITEWCEHGSLDKYIFSPSYNRDCGLEILKSACRGLVSVHKAKIIHRDLKPENLLVAGMSPWAIKITDLGTSRLISGNEIYLTKGFQGTLAYAAPELWMPTHNHQVDVYSWGVIMWEVMTGSRIYETLTQTHPSVHPSVWKLDLSSYIGPKPASWPAEFAQLMHGCWQSDPAKRPSFVECLAVLEKLSV
ncbi:serine/threonine-protein kinase STY46 [Pelomyxa schiedti]|nr:serine/threonine-protein kinase STY46 [Pelomyxa schiedti]